MKMICESRSIFEMLASEQSTQISIIETFEIEGTNFYLCKCIGEYLDDDGNEFDTLYGCYFDGYDKALILIDEMGAKISALCEYQQLTGKKLPE